MANGTRVLITGGAGFIGSHVTRRFVRNYPDYLIVNADKLTYAGNLENLRDIENEKNYRFEKTDIVDKQSVLDLFSKYSFDGIIHLAAESHVDRSITGPDEFVMTNIVGTVNLLQTHAARISRRQKGWDSSVLLMISLIGFTAIGLAKGTANPVYKWGFDYLYQPIYSAISSLLAFMITSASYRAFKVKDWQAGVLMVSAVIVMLGQVGVGSMIYKGLPSWSSWIMSVINTAGMRGITIGGALGAVALSLRVLLGLERGYLGGDR